MSTVAGVFSETQLFNITQMADAMAFDERTKQQLVPQYDVLKAVQAVQTANVQPIFNKDGKIYKLQVEWDNFCEISVEDNEECVQGGNKSSTNAKEYEITQEKMVQFTVDEADFANNRFLAQEAFAKALVRADKELIEWLAQYAVARLNAFKGVNQLGSTGKAVVSGVNTYIDTPYWTPELLAYFNRAGIRNRYGTNFVLASGANMYESGFIAEMNKNDDDKRGKAAMMQYRNWYFDLFNIDTVNDPDLVTYLIASGALAMGSVNYIRQELVTTSDGVRMFTRTSNFMPSLSYDVYYETACSEDRVKHDVRVVLRADIFNNPAGCVEDNTGTLAFICGTES